MKVAVSIPDAIFEAAERLARQRDLPRSQLFAEALEAYIELRGSEEITALLNEVYDREVSAVDKNLTQAQFDSIGHEKW